MNKPATPHKGFVAATVAATMEMLLPTPAQKIDRSLDDARGRLGHLEQRLADAWEAKAKSESDANALAKSGASHQELDQAEAATLAASTRIAKLVITYTETAGEISDLEAEATAHAAAAHRAEVADEIDSLSQEIRSLAPAFYNVCAKLADAMGRAGAIAPEGQQVSTFFMRTRTEIAIAVAGVDQMLRSASIRTREGHTSPVRPVLPEMPVAVVEPEPPTTKVFTLHDVKWLTLDGTVETAAKLTDINLPVAVAEAALQHEVVVDPQSERAAKLRGLCSAHKPIGPSCTDLDHLDDPNAVPAEVVTYGRKGRYQGPLSGFQEHVGEARTAWFDK